MSYGGKDIILKIKKFRLFNDFELRLPGETKIAVLVGDNGVGKTSILEAVATATEGGEVERGDWYIYFEIDGLKSECDPLCTGDPITSLLIRGGVNEFLKKSSDNIVEKTPEITSMFRQFRKDVQFVFPYKNAVYVAFSDGKVLPGNALGKGFSSLLNFIIGYTVKKPSVVLIDDLEAFALHPELLKKFYDFLLSLNIRLTMIATQSSDVYAYLADRKLKEVKFVVIRDDGSYELFESEEVADMLYYEDLRYMALEPRGGRNG